MSARRPNIVFILTDDHAAHAMSCYGSRINRTPNLDRIAEAGVRFESCYCTNSICTPSRATILTGTYNHVNGATTLATRLDNRLTTFPKLLRAAGYQTAIVGKWHLGEGPEHCPTGFDYWNVLPGQGAYHDPVMIEMGEEKVFEGYATDLIADFSLRWLRERDRDRPFCLLCHHKAPHRPWEPDAKHERMYEDENIPLPESFDDAYEGRPAAEAAFMRVERDMRETDLKAPEPPGLGPRESKIWKYQRYIKDYLRCVASVDDNVGRLLDYLREEGLEQDTIVIYTSDQGFFLGDHGWYDKRFMYEESLKMPMVMSFPGRIAAGTVCHDMVLNVDFAPTLLDYCGIGVPAEFQGSSFRPVLEGRRPADWQTSMYYRYWMHNDNPHGVWAHYGVCTHEHKLIYYYGQPLGQKGARELAVTPYWELYDRKKDPCELRNVYGDPAYAGVVRELKTELRLLQERVGDRPVEEVG